MTTSEMIRKQDCHSICCTGEYNYVFSCGKYCKDEWSSVTPQM